MHGNCGFASFVSGLDRLLSAHTDGYVCCAACASLRLYDYALLSLYFANGPAPMSSQLSLIMTFAVSLGAAKGRQMLKVILLR